MKNKKLLTMLPLLAVSFSSCTLVRENTYTVTWKNYNGDILEIDESLALGVIPTYDGATPNKPKDSQYEYTFTGWSPAISEVTGNTTYVAQYEAVVNTYTVTWKNYDGSTLKTDTYNYGTFPNYTGSTPTKPEDNTYTYSFNGWFPQLANVTGDVTYTAQYGSTVKPGQNVGDNNEEQVFNSLVSQIKNGHNYTLAIHSQMNEAYEDEILDCERYNLNDKAWYSNYSEEGFEYEGTILQKNQGYVRFQEAFGVILTDYEFEATNYNAGISSLFDVIGENLFVGNYIQDKEHISKFTSNNIDNIAVAANMTQYHEYIRVGMLQTDNKVTATVDVTKNEITIHLDYWMYFFDEVEHIEPSYIDLTFKNIGTTTNDVLEAYIANPTNTYEVPTGWSEKYDIPLFNEWNNGVIPSFPRNISYAFSVGVETIEGKNYVAVTDKASGDLTSSYSDILEADGYSKNSRGEYTKAIRNNDTDVLITYKVILKYEQADRLNPKGVFNIYYRAFTETAAFESIESFNNYLDSNEQYNGLVPHFPNEATCTGVTNVKIPDHEGYDLWTSDWIRVNIPNYADAVRWFESYRASLISFGYNDVQETSTFLWNRYGWEDSTSSTCVMISRLTQEGYTGKVEIQFHITSEDAPKIRASQNSTATLSSISVSGYTTTYQQNATFSFDGVCTAFYSDGSSKVVTPSSVSTVNTSTPGTKNVTVYYKEGDITKTASYVVTVVAPNSEKYLVSIELGGNANLQFKQGTYFNHDGMLVTARYSDNSTKVVSPYATYTGYNTDNLGIQTVTVSYTEEGVTVTTTYKIKVSSSLTWPAIRLAKYEGLDSPYFMDVNGDDITNWNYNKYKSFYAGLWAEVGNEITSISVVGDPNATIRYDAEMYAYLITPTKNVEFDEVVIDYTLKNQTGDAAPHSVSADTNMTNGYIEFTSLTSLVQGQEVTFFVNPNSGYAVENVYVVDNYEITLSTRVVEGKTQYYFVMPNYDVVISATFVQATVTHNVSKEVPTGGSIILINGPIGTVGEEYLFSASAESGYELVNVFIKDHPEITISYQSGDALHGGAYYFVMPDFDVVISMEVNKIGGGNGGNGEQGGDGSALINGTSFANLVTIEGTLDDGADRYVLFTFNADGTGSLQVGTGFLATIHTFNYELSLSSGNSYNIYVSNVTRTAGSNQGFTMQNMTSMTVTINGNNITSFTYVATSSGGTVYNFIPEL